MLKSLPPKTTLISMLFSSFAKCASLREVSGAMLGLSGKTKHFQLRHIPKRGTLSDANMRKDADVFGCIYNDLFREYGHFISDSRIREVRKKQVQIMDSTNSEVLQDTIIEVTVKENNSKLKLRKVPFYERVLKREFEFLTNLFELRADLIAAINKLRWQIELLFRQLKQNFPLKYFWVTTKMP